MPRERYTRGRAIGYMARDYLRGWGYWVVLSTGSRDPVDLVAWKDPGVLFVKVGRLRRRVPAVSDIARQFSGDIAALRKIRPPLTSTIHLWVWTTGEGWRFYQVLPGGIMELESGVVV
jgi:hypothetical protein